MYGKILGDDILLKALLKIVSLAAVGSGLVLMGLFAVQNFTGGVSKDTVGELTDNMVTTTEETERGSPVGPEDKTLKLTVPKMERVQNITIPTAVPDQEALRNNAAVRMPGTGLPWEKETNVYIAGHELGYLGTPSFRAFYDLKKLEKGDEIYITDANGDKYTYEVFKIMIVQPTDLWVLDPLEGKNIVSLQGSETQQQVGDNIPKRVVRAELVETTNSSLEVS